MNWFLFYGIIFISFGLGVMITQIIGEMPSGIWWLGIGFLFLGIVLVRDNIKKKQEKLK